MNTTNPNESRGSSERKGPIVGEVVDPPENRSPTKTMMVAIVGVLMVVYLLNPLAGIDLLPDMLPIVGNLDEATATAVLLGCLSYFGVDLPWLRNRKQ